MPGFKSIVYRVHIGICSVSYDARYHQIYTSINHHSSPAQAYDRNLIVTTYSTLIFRYHYLKEDRTFRLYLMGSSQDCNRSSLYNQQQLTISSIPAERNKRCAAAKYHIPEWPVICHGRPLNEAPRSIRHKDVSWSNRRASPPVHNFKSHMQM